MSRFVELGQSNRKLVWIWTVYIQEIWDLFVESNHMASFQTFSNPHICFQDR